MEGAAAASAFAAANFARVAASLPDPGPDFIPPHIYASTYSNYSSSAAGGRDGFW